MWHSFRKRPVYVFSQAEKDEKDEYTSANLTSLETNLTRRESAPCDPPTFILFLLLLFIRMFTSFHIVVNSKETRTTPPFYPDFAAVNADQRKGPKSDMKAWRLVPQLTFVSYVVTQIKGLGKHGTSTMLDARPRQERWAFYSKTLLWGVPKERPDIYKKKICIVPNCACSI